MSSTLDFARLQPPQTHAETLIEPSAAALSAILARNRGLLGQYRFKLLDRPVQEVRAETRAACGIPEGRPVVLTGHQPAFIHPGIWAKHIVATRLAQAVDGVAANLVVENDAPNEFVVRVPHEPPDRPGYIVGVRYADASRGTPFEFLPAMPASGVARLETEVREALGERWAGSLAGRFFEGLRQAEGATGWVEQMLSARRGVESEFGVALRDLRSGTTWGGPLLGELLANARRFAAAYNAALAEYRAERHVASPQKPFPNLEVGATTCELPFWAYRPGGVRKRVALEERGTQWILLADAEPIATFAPQSVTTWHSFAQFVDGLGPWVLRPRALTLTLWARLLLGDLFIHGLGGADYDRVTDGLIRRYFEVEPPAMACVSATLLWCPEAARVHGALAEARRRARDVHFNPQRYVVGDDLEPLRQARQAAIAESLHLREHAPHDRLARRQAFHAIREANAALASARPEVRADLERALGKAERLAASTRIGRDREVFFAFYPQKELARLAAAVPGVQAFG
ncbi:MAG: hypothetical protein IT303_18390 [Dehalococcoidia bacterium]|nr:hypothetical protein [Dehalococcoidia bacterium]